MRGVAHADTVRARLSDAQTDAIAELARSRPGNRDGRDDLVAIGAAAIGALLAELIGMR